MQCATVIFIHTSTATVTTTTTKTTTTAALDGSTKRMHRCMTETCDFKLNDSEWIFNQTNILFIYHLIRLNHFWALDNFHLFSSVVFDFLVFFLSFFRVSFTILFNFHRFTFAIANGDELNWIEQSAPNGAGEHTHTTINW